MKQLTRREFTAAAIISALGVAGVCFAAGGCDRYDTSDNFEDTVYGPPDAYEPRDNKEVDVYGPPDDYEPSENLTPLVYGPPDAYD